MRVHNLRDLQHLKNFEKIEKKEYVDFYKFRAILNTGKNTFCASFTEYLKLLNKW